MMIPFCRCIIGLVVITWLDHISGNTLLINGIPYHCPQFDATYLNFTTASSLQGQSLDDINSIEFKNVGYNVFYLSTASLYLVGDVVWLIMVWSVASIGTPTEPGRRDKYLRCVYILTHYAWRLFVLKHDIVCFQ